MRAILALAILFLCLSSAAPETTYSSLLHNLLALQSEAPPLVEIESSVGKADRLPVAMTARFLTGPAMVEIESSRGKADRLQVAMAGRFMAGPEDESFGLRGTPDLSIAALGDDAPAADAEDTPSPANAGSDHGPIPLGDLCNALMTSAQNNDLPVAFFANLIWQESRLRDDAVSPKGALGIAQFMPKVALESGLENPLDPMQALPASARMLRDLRSQFRNLGFAAAAYNAGPRRVSQWLERHRTLPRETRGYVLNITGRSVEQWRRTPPDAAALQFARRLPCRDLPAFAELEQAQQQAHDDQAAAPEQPVVTAYGRRHRHGGRRIRGLARQQAIHTAEGEGHRGGHEARVHGQHARHEHHRSA